LPIYKDVLWVEELPEELDDDTLYFYPNITENPNDKDSIFKLEAINRSVKEDGLDPAAYGLSDPITMNEFLNKRDAMTQIIYDVDNTTWNRYYEFAKPGVEIE
jgi:hypothetical protein